MSRASAQALIDLLSGLTLTDTGLSGSPVALSGAVKLVTARDATVQVASPCCYLVGPTVSTQREGILGASTAIYEVLLVLGYTDDAEALLAGAEVLDQVADAALNAVGTVAHEVQMLGSAVRLDRDGRRLQVYATLSLSSLRG